MRIFEDSLPKSFRFKAAFVHFCELQSGNFNFTPPLPTFLLFTTPPPPFLKRSLVSMGVEKRARGGGRVKNDFIRTWEKNSVDKEKYFVSWPLTRGTIDVLSDRYHVSRDIKV